MKSICESVFVKCIIAPTTFLKIKFNGYLRIDLQQQIEPTDEKRQSVEEKKTVV